MLSERFLTCSKCGAKPPAAMDFSIGDQVLCERCSTAPKPDWETEIRRIADELWEEAERPTDATRGKPTKRVLKTVSTNLHRLCQRMAGREPLPAPGARLAHERTER
jgi:hypothetical protein